MKNHIVLLAASAFMLMSIIPNVAKAQDPFRNLTQSEAVATFRVPDIVDFVTVFLNTSEDEHHGSLQNIWQKHLNNKPLDRGDKVTVDARNGYVRFESSDDSFVAVTEMCYWNCSDGLHKLFAENLTITQNGRPIYTEYSGLCIYVYDNATQKLYWCDQELLGLTDDVRGDVTFNLPRNGKDIEVLFHNNSRTVKKTLAWNGKGFTLKN